VRRWIGAVTGIPIKLLTLALLLEPKLHQQFGDLIGWCLWIIAILTFTMLMGTLWYERARIWQALNEG
jgi:hypothetical protein